MLLAAGCAKRQTDVLAYVDPFIGTEGHGHTFPGATTPFGMVQLSPDNGTNAWDWCSGYHYSDTVIVGFSHTHISGTGVPDLADVSVMPVTIRPDIAFVLTDGDPKSVPWISSFSHQREEASPGYYRVFLDTPRVEAELTATPRTGMHRYTYPSDAEEGLVVDLDYNIWGIRPLAERVTVVDSCTVTGYRFSDGMAKEQKLFFAMRFSRPIREYLLSEVGGTPAAAASVEGTRVRGWFGFGPADGQPLLVKTGISSVDAAGALANLQAENPGWDFDAVKQAAQQRWREELERLKVTSEGAEDAKKIFYTAFYHALIAPNTFSDVDGRYRGADDSIRVAGDYTYYSTLSLWDTFRAWAPLMFITDPGMTADLMNTMLGYYDQAGQLPVWTLWNTESYCMTGNNAIPVVLGAYNSGIRDFDRPKMLEAMKKSMDVDIRDLDLYKKYGYVPYDKADISVSTTLDYAFNDWCVGQFAKALGREEDHAFYDNRSRAYRFLFDPETCFFRGRNAVNTAFRLGFDPAAFRAWGEKEFIESNAWMNNWSVMHDIPELMEMQGGKEAFAALLDTLFTRPFDRSYPHVPLDVTGLVGNYAHGNEQTHHIAYLYNYAGQPRKTQERVRQIMESQYAPQRDGLCGNDDCGQISAWYVLSAMGMYAVNPAGGEYQLGIPLFDRLEIGLENGNRLVIEAPGAATEKHVSEVWLNDEKLEGATIRIGDIQKGGTLKFVLED